MGFSWRVQSSGIERSLRIDPTVRWKRLQGCMVVGSGGHGTNVDFRIWLHIWSSTMKRTEQYKVQFSRWSRGSVMVEEHPSLAGWYTPSSPPVTCGTTLLIWKWLCPEGQLWKNGRKGSKPAASLRNVSDTVASGMSSCLAIGFWSLSRASTTFECSPLEDIFGPWACCSQESSGIHC